VEQSVLNLESEFGELEVKGASPEILASLELKGITVAKLSSGSAFLSINCVNSESFGDAESKLLLPIKDNTVWLNLASTEISDAAITNIKQCINLTRLNLSSTRISDEGIRGLTSLRSLQYLTLVDTEITDRSLEYLKELKKLKAVYLWKTKVTNAGVAKLGKHLPNTIINLGE
jgi:Leucine-rich repeat (LRR) protein